MEKVDNVCDFDMTLLLCGVNQSAFLVSLCDSDMESSVLAHTTQ